MENWKSKFKGGMLFILLLTGLGCNAVTNNSQQNVSDLSGLIAIILGANFSDPVGTLSAISLDNDPTATVNVQTTHSDAVVTSFNDTLFVVNRLGQDNIQIVDPTNDFEVTQQFSVGPGTNPQHIVVINSTKAYLTLYQPENNSGSFSVDDLLILNPSTGQITNTIDLTPFTANDGERLARASSMVRIGNKLYIALQDLTGAFFANQPGKLIEVDIQTDTVSRSLTLQGFNPFAIKISLSTGLLYVTQNGNFNTSSNEGGIEVVNPTTMTTQGIVMDDATLDGFPGDIEFFGTTGFMTVSLSDFSGTKIVSFPTNLQSNSTITDLYETSGFIQDIAVAPGGNLLIGDRDPSNSGIVILDPSAPGTFTGPIGTGPAPSSITFVDL